MQNETMIKQFEKFLDRETAEIAARAATKLEAERTDEERQAISKALKAMQG